MNRSYRVAWKNARLRRKRAQTGGRQSIMNSGFVVRLFGVGLGHGQTNSHRVGKPDQDRATRLFTIHELTYLPLTLIALTHLVKPRSTQNTVNSAIRS